MKRSFKLWLSFAVNVIIIMVITMSVTGVLAFKVFALNVDKGPAHWIPVITLILTAILVSTSLMLIVSKHMFVPAENLIEALQKVSGGDFSIRLPENQEDPYAYSMNVNFNKMVKELNSMEMLQSDFIQNVSHEFKTPLASIEGYATLLNGAPLPEDLHTYSQHILESARQLSALTGNILKLSKLENQGIISQKESFSLDEQIRQALLSLEPLWEPKHLDIDMELPETTFYGNENLMFQVWTNLFSNAVKFTPPGGFICVRCRKTPEDIQVEIRDTGIGMSPEVQAHIFDKFYQGEQNRNIEGNGLGLALVFKIISLCNGRIHVESRPDEGAAFTVYLPVEHDNE
ncbi:HAMP domain-containing sensor histidine kinase [Enterocloster asparagiformis]|uniref:HAMP domain-containing sensor histidine kinase n=1 Tax=Enterocloster asparagiformis TaxID=333367 RepID=UPI0004663BEF|nr:HAMP domain-containing sensor histidine kinase [Enterocloster asparagiformis]